MEIKKYTILILALVLYMASCSKTNPDNVSIQLPVVESYLVAGNPVTVKVYEQKSLTDTATYGEPLTGLQVYVSDGSTSVLLTESSKGTYVYNNNNFLVSGKTYSLQFKYLTYNVSAKTVMPSKATNFAATDTLVNEAASSDSAGVLSWVSPDQAYHVLVFKDLDYNDAPINNFGHDNFQVDVNKAPYYQITTPIFSYYGYYNVILLSVDQEYINLIKTNSFSATSQNLTNISTNVVNGFGIFTAMQADTLGMEVN